MTHKWIKAAERYEASKKPVFKTRRKRAAPEKPRATLASFMANGSWEAATKLLAAADLQICLGYSEAAMSRTSAVIIDGEGLKRHSGVVGMAAAYTSEKPRQEPINAAQAISMLENFPSDGNMLVDHDEDKLVASIKEQLDEIASAAP
ncbi:hypothetical protein N9L26_01165 [Candidatus Pacebacteria bacterium]|nr:hypothetical protein [Candidatus Paceibacterota bacterium]